MNSLNEMSFLKTCWSYLLNNCVICVDFDVGWLGVHDLQEGLGVGPVLLDSFR